MHIVTYDIFTVSDYKLISLQDIGHVVPVASNEKVKILWNFSFNTTTRIKANRYDIVMMEEKKKLIYS